MRCGGRHSLCASLVVLYRQKGWWWDMDDVRHANTLFMIFGLCLFLYGLALVKTGDVNLLPYAAQHSVANSDDVRRVGRIVVVIGLVLLAITLLVFLIR